MSIARFCASHYTGPNSIGFGRTTIGADSAAAARSRASFSLAAGSRMTAVGVSSVTFLNQIYNIRDGSSKLSFTNDSTTYTINIPHGNYSSSELLDEITTIAAALTSRTFTYTIDTRKAIISVTAGAPTASFTFLLDPRLSDTILVNMLGYETINLSSTTTHTASRTYCMTRDLSISLHVQGTGITLSNYGEEREHARTSRMTDAIFTLPLKGGFGAVETFVATTTPAYVSLSLPGQAFTLFWCDSRGAPLDPERSFQWEVTGHAVL